MSITLQQAAELLLGNDQITLLCHRSPDGDTIGSACGLYHGLTQLGKQCRVRCCDDFPQDIAELIACPTRTEGFQESYVVAVDVADIKLLGALEEEYTGRVDLAIDHHPSHKDYAKAAYVEGDAAATAQVIHKLLGLMGVRLTTQIASCIYLGLATDTGCFRYTNTTAATMRAAADMLAVGVDSGRMNTVLFETKKPGRVALECRALEGLEYFYDGRCAVMTVTQKLLDSYKVEESELEGISALPRQISGVWVGATIREQDGHCRVSIRTSPEADAAAICGAFGGGGHLRAAGCSISGDPHEVRELLVREIGRHLTQPEV